MKNNYIILFALLGFLNLNQKATAQQITIPESLNKIIQQEDNLYKRLELLIQSLKAYQLNKDLLCEEVDITYSMLESIQSELIKDSTLKIELLNCYPINNDYMLSIAFSNTKNNTKNLSMIFNLIAKNLNNEYLFTIPLQQKTKHWKSTKVGNISYFYKDTIQIKRAKLFDNKNTIIANKLGVDVESFKFYMCENYQEILNLTGFSYHSEYVGQTRDGYGVDSGIIFSVMNNEDFSHDIFHYYSGKINERKNRNWITEEGIAYSWGNAYYTDSNGEMIDQKKQIETLKKFLDKNPKTDLLALFEKNAKPFPKLAPEVSIRSILSGLICDKVEKENGRQGILELINCGSQNRFVSYFNATNKLVNINRDNFNAELLQLINSY